MVVEGDGFQAVRKCHKIIAASHLLKNSLMRCFVSGHDFSRADKAFNLDPPRGL